MEPAKHFVESLKKGLRNVLNRPTTSELTHFKANIISESDVSSSSSSDEGQPPVRKRISSEIGGGGQCKKIKTSLVETENSNMRSYDVVLSDVRRVALQRKERLLQFKLDYNWSTAPSLSCPATDPTIPRHLIHQFRAVLRSKKKNYYNETSTFYPQDGQRYSPAAVDQKPEIRAVSSSADIQKCGEKTNAPFKPPMQIDLSLDDPTEAGEDVSCPICGKLFPSFRIENHATACASRTFED